MINGIDVTDPTYNFSSQEWEALGPANRALTMQMRNHANGPNSCNTGGQGCGRGQSHSDNAHNNASANVSFVTFEDEVQEQDASQSEGT